MTKIKKPLAFLMSILMMCTFSFSDGLLSFVKSVKAEESQITGEAVAPTNGDGSASNPYEIANYDNLVWFQQEVDKGGDNLALCAKLVADITANEDLTNLETGELKNTNATPNYTWTPIAQNAASLSDSYSGTFDGDGHYISGLYYNNSNTDYVGLFGFSKGTIKNLIIKDSYFNGRCKVGTFIGYTVSNNKIENCGSNAIIKGVMYCGGISGQPEGEITNCYYVGKIDEDSTYSNAIASEYYTYEGINNCYYLNSCGLSSNRATSKTATEIENGAICEGVGYHSYVDGNCLLCSSPKEGVTSHYNFDTSKKYKNLGLAIYMKIPEEVVNTLGSSVKVTLPNNEVENYPIAQAQTFYDDIETLYVFPLNIAPYELAKTVKVQFIYGDNQSEIFEFNVRDSVKKELSVSESAINALLNYGAAAQKYFNQSTNDLANKDITDTTDVILNSETISSLKTNYGKTKVSDENIGTFTGLDLVLGATMTLNMHFVPADGVDVSTIAFTINGNAVTPKQVADGYVLSVENIGIQNVKNTLEFKANDLEIECNVLNYIASVLNDENSTDDLKKLASKLYNYYNS